MSLPPTPKNETERLAALRSYQILDTPHESEYDDLVALAAELCGTPMAAITLIDEYRQWFKASVGMGARETSRDISFCAHVVASDEQDLVVVNNATRDPRFSDMSVVTGPDHIRFYAGAPLIMSDGFRLGSLCVVDREPRLLAENQRRALRVLRRHVVESLELRRYALAQRANITALEAAQVELERARQAAESANRAKSQFLAAMSHEIRTPMNAVIGMTALLRATELNGEQVEYVDTLRTSGELLLTIINDILDFSKIESGRLELEQTSFSLTDSLEGAIGLISEAARSKGLHVTIEIAPGTPDTLVGDSARLRQIVINLLSNAVKFTSQGGITIRVWASLLSERRVEVKLDVADTGIGIPPDRMARLFQPYVQADASTTRLYGGTGLGLVISRKLAELHGGSLWAESIPGRGSTFHVTIVAGIPRVGSRPPIPIAPAPLFDAGFARRHPARILLAEDNVVNQRVATRMLEKLGYAPVVASHGQEAVDRAQQEPFDVIFMDVEMPVLNGFEATQAIRRQLPADRQPLIAALTAHMLGDDRDSYTAAGFDEILAKPVRLEVLTSILARAAESKSA
jgi:signal transduction histidine kinase/ActR/RegA family two-component response regulator